MTKTIKEGRSSDRSIGELIQLRDGYKGGMYCRIQSHELKSQSDISVGEGRRGKDWGTEGAVYDLVDEYDIDSDNAGQIRRNTIDKFDKKYKGRYNKYDNNFDEESGEEFIRITKDVMAMYEGFLSILQAYLDNEHDKKNEKARLEIDNLRKYLDKHYEKKNDSN